MKGGSAGLALLLKQKNVVEFKDDDSLVVAEAADNQSNNNTDHVLTSSPAENSGSELVLHMQGEASDQRVLRSQVETASQLTASQSVRSAPPVKYAPKVVKMSFESTPKCTVCNKSVYKMEEVIAVGRIWHKTCFTCGGSCTLAHKQGCKRVLARDGYLDHENEPYCNACYSRLFKPKGYGIGTSLELDYGPGRRADAAAAPVTPENKTPPPPTQHTGLEVKPTTRGQTVKSNGDGMSAGSSVSIAPTPAVTLTPTPTPPVRPPPPPVAVPNNTNQGARTPKLADANAAPKCTICLRTVYKAEEMVAVGHVWHKSCFTCGARAGDGCRKVLNRQNYVDHDNCPYCTACHNKLFRPKGFGYSNALMLDYGPTAASVGASSDASTTISSVSDRNLRESDNVDDNGDDDSKLRLEALVIDPSGSMKPMGVSNDFPAAHLTGPIPTIAPSLEIGRTSATRGNLHKEASYVGNNDEVDEDEWN
jgi:cysteine/glycine-rich protein